MPHIAIERVLKRVEISKSGDDLGYFVTAMYAAEAVSKTIILGMISALEDDREHHKYRLEHTLVRADGIGQWCSVLDDAIQGHASPNLIPCASNEKTELTIKSKIGNWQYDSVTSLIHAMKALGLNVAEFDNQNKYDMRSWFRLFAILRNKTRGHGATSATRAGLAADYLMSSTTLFYKHFSLFSRPWAYLHQNISGRYHIAPITEIEPNQFDIENDLNLQLPDGIYIHFDTPRLVPLIESNLDLDNFYYSNGGFSSTKYELLSYLNDNRIHRDVQVYLTPPNNLPKSETSSSTTYSITTKSFSNAPDLISDYIARPGLETEILDLLNDDHTPIITLAGMGGIGKTSLALKCIKTLEADGHFEEIVWFSARDVDLQQNGPKPVQPDVFNPKWSAVEKLSQVL